MRSIFLVILAITLLGVSAAHAGEVLVIQGLHVKPYNEAVRGFRETCAVATRTLYLPDLEGADIVRTVREERPTLILAIGSDALKKVRAIKDVPIVYLMVVDPQPIVKGNRNVTGVSMTVPPEKYLDLLAHISPKPQTIGVISDPTKSGHLVKRAEQAARVRGIALKVREVGNSRDVPEALARLKGEADVLWMFPDTTVVTPETVELFLLTSQQSRIPVISFSGKYVEMGALAALDIDGFDEGRQAGEIAAKILNKTPVADLPGAEARRAAVKVNRNVAKKLGIHLDGIDRFKQGAERVPMVAISPVPTHRDRNYSLL